ncbi:hypothetical protein, partial [Klebsiella pneumoniae]|uniref:hypothetical protein n=1 Tax=Klebsiella pneumoniae TaxID=573 RepID=UPI00163DCA3D
GIRRFGHKRQQREVNRQTGGVRAQDKLFFEVFVTVVVDFDIVYCYVRFFFVALGMVYIDAGDAFETTDIQLFVNKLVPRVRVDCSVESV